MYGQPATGQRNLCSGSVAELVGLISIKVRSVPSNCFLVHGCGGIVCGSQGLSRVALSGEYRDLTGAPSIVPVNADWSETDTTKLSFIRNKPVVSAAGVVDTYFCRFA